VGSPATDRARRTAYAGEELDDGGASLERRAAAELEDAVFAERGAELVQTERVP
jgi:hypothetical protein